MEDEAPVIYGLEFQVFRQYPGNVPPPSKPEDSIFCKTVNSYGMKVNITI